MENIIRVELLKSLTVFHFPEQNCGFQTFFYNSKTKFSKEIPLGSQGYRVLWSKVGLLRNLREALRIHGIQF